MVPEQAKRGGGSLRIGRALKHPLTERQIDPTIAARIHIEIGRRAHQPRSINRTVNAARQRRLVGSGHAGVHVERGSPERTTGWGGRRSRAVGPNAQQKKARSPSGRETDGRSAATRGTPSHTLRPALGIVGLADCHRKPAEGKRGGRRRRRIDRVAGRRIAHLSPNNWRTNASGAVTEA